MQIGIDLGATKIESVLLDNDGSELHRSRKDSPQNYKETIESIKNSVNFIENEFKKKFTVGVCHPGSTNLDTGLIQNAYNSIGYMKDMVRLRGLEPPRIIHPQRPQRCASTGSATAAQIY